MDRYKELIKNMPVDEQSFTTKKTTWQRFIDQNISSEILCEIFGDKDEIELSRADLFNIARGCNINKLIISTILWGYPRGMRGNHFENISSKLEEIKECLLEAKSGIENWNNHYEKLSEINGIGLSTYTKLLYFYGAKVGGLPCVILDQRIIDSVNKSAVSGLEALEGIAPYNASGKYPEYLDIIDKAAKKYTTTNGRVEMFIFSFGLNIKVR